jgi:hypothetical protein
VRELNVEKIVVNGDTMTAYLTRKGYNFEEKVVRKVKLENIMETWKEQNKPLYEWCKEQGFEKVLPGWSGYAYAKRGNVWYEIDLWDRKIERTVGRSLDRNYFLSLVIPEDEWGSWVKNVKVVIKKHP